MQIAREALFAALFATLSNSYGFRSVSRRFRLWSDVAYEERPALFLREGDETRTGGDRGLPPVVTLDISVFIYVNTTDSEIPGAELNPILDAIEQALLPSPVTGKQTLGGLVDHVWLDGKLMKDTGDLDGDAIAIIPLKILLT